MAESYPVMLCREVSSTTGKVMVVGEVDGYHPNGVYIRDRADKCKLIGVPKDLKGLVEVWGEVTRGEVLCKGYNQFNDTNFDFESHETVLMMTRNFNEIH